MADLLIAPRHCIQHSRFTKQDGWRLDDLSYNLGGIISVTSYNNDSHQTSIDLYSVRNSVDRDKPKIHFTKDFEQYSSGGVLLRLRSVALVCDNTLVSCLGNILEVVRLNEDMVVISRTVNEKSRCLAVRKEEIFMGFYQSNKINIYDLKELLEIRSIVLQGLRNDVYPFDMAVTADKILVCLRDLSKITEDFPRVIEEKNGKTLHEFTRPKVVHSYARSVTACAQLGIVAVLWSESLFYVVGNLNTIEFYSLFSNNNSSFLTFEIDSGFSRIRVSDKGDMMITGNMDSGEVQIYYMEDLISYNNLKKFVSSQLQREECVRLAMFFSLSKEVLHIIEKCDTPAEIFLLALEGKDIIQASNVERLTIAFRELNMPSSHSQVTEFYQKTRRSPCVDETTCDLKEPVALTRDQAANAPDLASSITEEDLITYGNLKKKLILQLKKEECLTLAAFFSFTKQETENIEMSDTPVELLLLALEDKGVLQESNVNNLTEAFHKLEMPSSCIQVIEFYHKTMTYDDAMSDLTEPLILINDQSGEKAADSTEPESDTTEEDLITYGNLKKKLTLQLKKEVCLMLAAFFSFTKEETEKIEMSDTPVELLLLALEDKGVLQESNVNNLTEAFHKLEMPSSCIQMIEFYQKTMTYDDAMSDLTESFMLMKDQSKEEAADSTEPESDTTETTWTRHMAPDGRTYYVNSVTKQATWENPHNLQSHAEALREREEMYLNLSKNASDFLHESSFEGELAKLSVRVSENLTKANCMKLATYFNFPVSKMDLIQNDNETPGLTLFAVMKERHVINIHNVMALKEALEELKLIDISDTLVIPYQRKIDRLRFEQGYLSPQ